MTRFGIDKPDARIPFEVCSSKMPVDEQADLSRSIGSTIFFPSLLSP